MKFKAQTGPVYCYGVHHQGIQELMWWLNQLEVVFVICRVG